MKKIYMKPRIEMADILTDDELLIGSGEQLPTAIYDDETAGGGESLSRKADFWADDGTDF